MARNLMSTSFEALTSIYGVEGNNSYRVQLLEVMSLIQQHQVMMMRESSVKA
ncbi:uncharacterized protein G2W53_032694 [Senna tora]|uniref:Uncharacterized protein n=1 Tax=Senna tora TaxID=362788 RepID=A0A834SWC8_9FABA|nr:uncharacterized protein G2W53_032694 [Senna tora]